MTSTSEPMVNVRGSSPNTVSGEPKILVVGSGPSGLIVALSLLKNGVPVRIIEKGTSWKVGQRGAGIIPRSLELLESLGVLEHVLQRGTSVPMIRFYQMPGGTETLKEMSPTPILNPTPAFPYRNFVTLGQDNLEAILRAEIAKFGCRVELGAELEGLKISEDSVEATILYHQHDSEAPMNVGIPPQRETVSYEWVVGADGARGTVRKHLGLMFVGETRSENFITGDIILDEGTGLDPNRWHIWGEVSDVLASIRSTETPSLFSFVLGGANLPPADVICASVESVKDHIKRFTGGREDIGIKEVVWMSPFKINIRMAEKFREGHVFVVGDAGHVHSMTGGQGMNTGIQDSFNLGWKLALVSKGLAPPSLLDSYTSERVPIVAEMLDITTTILKNTVTDNHGKGWDRSGSVHQLGVNYRGSAIVFDETSKASTPGEGDDVRPSYAVEEGSPVQPGDRAPDAPGLVRLSPTTQPLTPTTRLFDLFSPSRHTIIIFASSDATGDNSILDYPSVVKLITTHPVLKNVVRVIFICKAGDLVENIDDSSVEVFEDEDGHAAEAYKGKDGTLGVFVVRPDGVVGAKIASVNGLKTYFEGILGGI